jgi:hypothetical protein
MAERFDFDAYARQVRSVSRSLVCSGKSATDIAGRMHLLAVAAERDLLRFGEPAELSKVACGPGCGNCCVLNVSVLFPEAIAIFCYLERSLLAEERNNLHSRLHELSMATRWLDDEERLFLREACAFLDRQRLCMIHRVRPLLCRAITSTNPADCREAIAMAPLDGLPCVEMNLFQNDLFATVYRGLAAALGDAGLDHRPKRLPSAVLALLDEPGLADAFAVGAQLPVH